MRNLSRTAVALSVLWLPLPQGCSDTPTVPPVIFEGSLEPLGNTDLWVAGHKLSGPSVSYQLIGRDFIFDGIATVDYYSGWNQEPPASWVELQARDLIAVISVWIDEADLYPEGALILVTHHGNHLQMTGEYREEAQAQIDHVLAGKPISELPYGPLDPAAAPLREIIEQSANKGGAGGSPQVPNLQPPLAVGVG